MSCNQNKSSFIPIKSSMKLYMFLLKNDPLLLCHHVMFMTVKWLLNHWRFQHGPWWDVTRPKMTIFVTKAEKEQEQKKKKRQKLRNDGRTRPASLTSMTSVEALVSWRRLVMQMGNRAPRDTDRPNPWASLTSMKMSLVWFGQARRSTYTPPFTCHVAFK